MKRNCLCLLIVSLLLLSKAIAVEDPESTQERQFDYAIISNLVQRSSLVIVGEIVTQSAADPYKMALGVNTPFTVKVVRVIHGSAPQNELVTIGVNRSEVKFRYPIGEQFL